MRVHNIEQRTPEWIALHCGIPTSSEFKKLITSTGKRSASADEYAMVLAADKYAGRPIDRFDGNKYTDRGIEFEPDARTNYEFMTDSVVEEVGFVTDDAVTHGCSPDGFVDDDGLAEFKCLIAKEHVKVMLYYQQHGKCPTTYVQQTQGQMMICKRKWCDLVFYHPDLPMVIIRQKPDPVIFRALREQIQAVIEERDSIFRKIEELGNG